MTKTPSADTLSPRPEMDAEAWVIVGPCLHPSCISDATFDGGILETAANVESGSRVPLRLPNGDETFTLQVQLFTGADGRFPFRLCDTTGMERGLWDAFVRERHDRSQCQ